ncbi:helix-turn-helix domain-containing protein [Neobacillus dielmonensis]|uniref:hypothetical protein n=1 Tax=Neobacillus dielmonensis TaxID=1347369 RepID=UPI0009453656|nr:hypothetical protein [Neobacillus dielmonensis]
MEYSLPEQDEKLSPIIASMGIWGNQYIGKRSTFCLFCLTHKKRTANFLRPSIFSIIGRTFYLCILSVIRSLDTPF